MNEAYNRFEILSVYLKIQMYILANSFNSLYSDYRIIIYLIAYNTK